MRLYTVLPALLIVTINTAHAFLPAASREAHLLNNLQRRATRSSPAVNRPVALCDRRPATTTSASSSTRRTFSTKLFASSPKPLAKEGSWAAYLDEETTGLIYYFNIKTGESRWVPPTETFPIIELPSDLQEKAEAKQIEYREIIGYQQEGGEQEEGGSSSSTGKRVGKGLLTTLLPGDEKQGTTTGRGGGSRTLDSTPKVKKEAWYSFLKEADRKPETKEVDQLADKAEVPPERRSEPSDEWFSWTKSFQKDVKTKVKLTGKVKQQQAPPETDVNGGAETTAAPAPSAAEEAAAADIAEEKKLEVERKKKLSDRLKTELMNFLQPAEEIESERLPRTIIVPEMYAYVSPAPSKIFWGGEDAIFVKGRTFGVFDGVSGASKIDGRVLYSKMMASELKRNIPVEKAININDMYKLLNEAKDLCNKKATGATTAVVASIGEDGFLRVLNVGDSTCVVVRNGKVAARTREQNHFYECPYQFSEISPDQPRDGTKLNLELVEGDLVVMGSDGVFDNLSDDEVIKIIKETPKTKINTMAKRIVDRSRKVSLDPKAATPFAKNAKRNNNPDYSDGLGGKVDDACCIVVRYG